MAGTFKFELVSPERIVVSGDAEQALLPGTEGDMTILSGHAPVMSTLRPGVVQVTIDGAKTQMFVSRAFAEVGPERVTVLAEKAYHFDDLNADVIAIELAAAERAHAEASEDHERFIAGEAVAALTKLKTAHW